LEMIGRFNCFIQGALIRELRLFISNQVNA
jgi:hypothetical protein